METRPWRVSLSSQPQGAGNVLGTRPFILVRSGLVSQGTHHIVVKLVLALLIPATVQCWILPTLVCYYSLRDTLKARQCLHPVTSIGVWQTAGINMQSSEAKPVHRKYSGSLTQTT